MHRPLPRSWLAVVCTLGLLVPALAQSIVGSPGAPVGAPTRTDGVQIDTFLRHSAARFADGTIAFWGANQHSQCYVWPLVAGTVYVDVSVGNEHSVALRSDGFVACSGNNAQGQCVPPTLPSGVRLVDVEAAMAWNLGLCSDGSVVTWGSPLGAAPAGHDFVAIAAGNGHALALRQDGTIAAWGSTYDGATFVPPLPAGLRYERIAAGARHSAAVRSDGRIVMWGAVQSSPLANVPTLPPGQSWIGLSSRMFDMLAQRSDGTVLHWGSQPYFLAVLPPDHAAVGMGFGYDHSYLLVTPAARFATFGAGCAGSLGVSRIGSSMVPRPGALFAAEIDRLPQDLAVVLLGLDAASSPFGPLPFDLGGLGMPGCRGHLRTDAVQFVLGSEQRATWSLAIPNLQGLLGLPFYVQALVPDPAAGNAAGVVISDAARGVIGPF